MSAEVFLNCISRIRFRCSFLWHWENQYMVHDFDSIGIAQFPLVICSVSAEGSLNCVAHSIRCFFFWLWVNYFCLFWVHLMLVYNSVQLSHTWSDFSRFLRVITSETRILCHFILFILSSILMKQLTCNFGIISFYTYRILIWIFSWYDLFHVTGIDTSCVLYIICSQLMTFEQVTLCCSYSA